MDGPGLNEHHLERLRTNLTALAEVQPDLARQLEQVEIPPQARIATGRDGSETFRLQAGDHSHWFGRSSMPEISAPILVRELQTQGHSVILPAIASGLEPVFAARQLPEHAAVFVYDGDIQQIKMALCLRDLAPLIAARRVVLLHGPNATQALAEFFTRHPGFEFPQHFLPLRHVAGNVGQARAQFESAAGQVTAAQWQFAGRISQELRQRSEFHIGQRPRICIVSRDARAEVVQLAHDLVLAGQELGWPALACVPDRPDRCHTVARLDGIRRHQPDILIVLNGMLGPLAGSIAPNQPVCHWLTTPDAAAIAQREGLNQAVPANRPHLVFCADGRLARQLLDAGLPPERVRVLELGVQPPPGPGLQPVSSIECETAPQSRAGAQPGIADAKGHVAVLADCPSFDAATVGITLASQVKLWNQLLELAGPAADRWTDSAAQNLLDHAERKTGQSIKEISVRNLFLDRIRHRLMPALVVRATVRKMIRAAVPLAVFGRGWDSDALVAPHVRPPPADAAQRWEIFRSAPVTVFPWFDHDVSLKLLECLAAGGCPVVRTAEIPLTATYPNLAPVQRVQSGSTIREILAAAQSLLADPKRRAAYTEPLQHEVLTSHTLASRLESIRAAF